MIPVHPKATRIEQVPVVRELGTIDVPVDTLTLYIGPERVRDHIRSIVDLRPGTYWLEYCWLDNEHAGEVCHTEEITVP